MRGRNPIVIHYVHDMARAIAFYVGVFDVKLSFESPGWSQLNFGALEVALHILYPGSSDSEASIPEALTPEAPIPHAGLNLEVDNIEEMQTHIERLGGRLLELREAEAGVPVRVASFQDSEGNGFELRQQP